MPNGPVWTENRPYFRPPCLGKDFLSVTSVMLNRVVGVMSIPVVLMRAARALPRSLAAMAIAGALMVGGPDSVKAEDRPGEGLAGVEAGAVAPVEADAPMVSRLSQMLREKGAAGLVQEPGPFGGDLETFARMIARHHSLLEQAAEGAGTLAQMEKPILSGVDLEVAIEIVTIQIGLLQHESRNLSTYLGQHDDSDVREALRQIEVRLVAKRHERDGLDEIAEIARLYAETEQRVTQTRAAAAAVREMAVRILERATGGRLTEIEVRAIEAAMGLGAPRYGLVVSGLN